VISPSIFWYLGGQFLLGNPKVFPSFQALEVFFKFGLSKFVADQIPAIFWEKKTWEIFFFDFNLLWG